MKTQRFDASAQSGEAAVADKLSIIMFSGTADKFIPLGVLSQAAAAMGSEVNIFVTGFALLGFTKTPHDLPFPAEFTAMAPDLVMGLKANKVASWDAMLRQAREMGAHVYACSMMSSVMGLKKEDFNDLVDDIVGAASFLQMSENAQTLFV
ncbi:MAG: DsrE/DsrF/DrsH-like family protein [Gemmatimonadaceae bacterium]